MKIGRSCDADVSNISPFRAWARSPVWPVFRRRVSQLRILGGALLFSLGTAGAQQLTLVGSGSSVPLPLYARWSQEYSRRSSNVQVKYLPIGTSEAIRDISHGSGDFSAGEIPLDSKESDKDGLNAVPVALIAIVPIYNLPDVGTDLRFSGEVLAEIFLGQIKSWNAPQIAAINPGVSLPALPIKVVHRPQGKGSNYIFTDFLSKTSAKFSSRIGVSPSPTWPVGESAERSSDMAEKVRHNIGSIGYVELQYAVKNHIPHAAVLNSAGRFVKASPESLAAACRALELPNWDRLSISLVNAPGKDSFPISSFTWLYLKRDSADPKRARALQDFLAWILSDGQQLAPQEGYSELPEPLRVAVQGKFKASLLLRDKKHDLLVRSRDNTAIIGELVSFSVPDLTAYPEAQRGQDGLALNT